MNKRFKRDYVRIVEYIFCSICLTISIWIVLNAAEYVFKYETFANVFPVLKILCILSMLAITLIQLRMIFRYGVPVIKKNRLIIPVLYGKPIKLSSYKTIRWIKCPNGFGRLEIVTQEKCYKIYALYDSEEFAD